MTQSNSYPHKYYSPVDLSKGDVNYDGILTDSDVSAISQYMAKYDNLSAVQLYLADYNSDGKINLSDCSAIFQAMNN